MLNKLRPLVILSILFLFGCFGDSAEREFSLTMFTSEPVSNKAQGNNIDSVYRGLLIPMTSNQICGGDVFAPAVKFARLDSPNATVFEIGKLAKLTESSSGVDAMLGSKADDKALLSKATAAVDSWKIPTELNAVKNVRVKSDVAKIIARDGINIAVLVSSNVANRDAVKKSMQTSNPKHNVRFIDDSGAMQETKDQLHKELCALTTEREKAEKKDAAAKPLAVAVFFLNEQISVADAPAKQQIQASALRQVPAPSVVVKPVPALPVAVKSAPPAPVDMPAPLVVQTPPPVVQQPVAVQSAPPPVIQTPVPAPAPTPVAVAKAPVKVLTADEQCKLKDRSFIGQGLCVSRLCTEDPQFIDTSFCKVYRERQARPVN